MVSDRFSPWELGWGFGGLWRSPVASCGGLWSPLVTVVESPPQTLPNLRPCKPGAWNLQAWRLRGLEAGLEACWVKRLVGVLGLEDWKGGLQK